MGGLMLLRFLQQMPAEWKDKYVEKVITLSTPWVRIVNKKLPQDRP